MTDPIVRPERSAERVVEGPSTIPRHVAIIMDGNGRWATKRSLPRVAGHRAGAEAVRRTMQAAVDSLRIVLAAEQSIAEERAIAL